MHIPAIPPPQPTGASNAVGRVGAILRPSAAGADHASRNALGPEGLFSTSGRAMTAVRPARARPFCG